MVGMTGIMIAWVRYLLTSSWIWGLPESSVLHGAVRPFWAKSRTDDIVSSPVVPRSLPLFSAAPYLKLSHIVRVIVLHNEGPPASSRTRMDCLVLSRLVWGSRQSESPRRAFRGLDRWEQTPTWSVKLVQCPSRAPGVLLNFLEDINLSHRYRSTHPVASAGVALSISTKSRSCTAHPLNPPFPLRKTYLRGFEIPSLFKGRLKIVSNMFVVDFCLGAT